MTETESEYRNLPQVYQHLSSFEEGRDLLQLIADLKGTILYDEKGIIPPGIAAAMTTDYLPGTPLLRPVVLINPKAPLEKQVTGAGHEGYHVWQDTQVKPLYNLDNPEAIPKLRLQMALIRIIEGAAAVTDAHRYKKIRRATGLNLSPPMLDPDADPRQMFDAFQRSSVAQTYDEHTILQFQLNITKHHITDPRKVFNVISADALGDMRRVGRLDLAPGSPSFLANYAGNEALVQSVLSYVTPENMRRAMALTP